MGLQATAHCSTSYLFYRKMMLNDVTETQAIRLYRLQASAYPPEL